MPQVQEKLEEVKSVQSQLLEMMAALQRGPSHSDSDAEATDKQVIKNSMDISPTAVATSISDENKEQTSRREDASGSDVGSDAGADYHSRKKLFVPPKRRSVTIRYVWYAACIML